MEWIACKEQLPEELVYVLACTDLGERKIAYYETFEEYVFEGGFNHFKESSRWRSQGGTFMRYEITHWMPLPEPPKYQDQ